MTEQAADVIIVGAGPAGASLAYFLSLKGYRVTVYDMAPRPATRPCGQLVPVQVEELIRIPDEIVLAEVRGYRVYLDGKLIGEKHGVKLGYVIDKRRLLENLLEQADRRFRVHVSVERAVKEMKWREAFVIATGVYWWREGDKILAVQARYKLRDREEDVVEIMFDSSLVGYYWVFPLGKGIFEIGVGGYASYNELVSRLERFAKSLGAERVSEIAGSPIYVGGAVPEALRSRTPRIGEAAGFVYPISGEGIRPSIASAKAYSNAMLKGVDPVAQLKNVIRWIRMQRTLLDTVKRSSPRLRARILASIPVDDAVGIALGTLPATRLITLAAKYGVKVFREMFMIGFGVR